MINRILTCILSFSFLLACPAAFAGWGGKSLSERKQKEIKRLELRKIGFDAYQKKLEGLDKRRLATADKQKVIRKKYADKKEKARKGFVRKTSVFPKQAYRAFIEKRRQKRKQLEQSRHEYSIVQKELKKIFKNKKYRINGNKEFKL